MCWSEVCEVRLPSSIRWNRACDLVGPAGVSRIKPRVHTSRCCIRHLRQHDIPRRAGGDARGPSKIGLGSGYEILDVSTFPAPYSLYSEETQSGFEPAKKFKSVQYRVEPAIGDAIVHIKRLRVMQLVMLRFQHQALSLQPTRESGWAFLMRPLVKLVSRDSCRRRESKRNYRKGQPAGMGH